MNLQVTRVAPWQLPFSLALSILIFQPATVQAKTKLPEQEPIFCTRKEEAVEPIPHAQGGMASVQVFTRTAALNIFDYPLGYAPPVGPAINFRINYNYLEAQDNQKRDFSNIGPGWTLNWVAFVSKDKDGNATVAVPGGGTEFYRLYSEDGQKKFKRNLASHALLIERPDGSFERQLPDGSSELYSLSDKKGRKLLIQLRTASGTAAAIGYDGSYRIITIMDALGQISKIKHVSDQEGSPGFFRVAEITDPFGRQAKFQYDNSMRLVSNTDSIGLVSKYTYQSASNNSIISLNTPYGTTGFSYYKPQGSPAGSLGLSVTHADGSKSVTEHWKGDVHETYQWNRRAIELYPNDPKEGIHTHCSVTRWLTQAGSGRELPVKASVKEPLQSEIVYSYIGMSPAGFNGNSNLPSSISRRVTVRTPDGKTAAATKTYSYAYNELGNMTRLVDPVGRSFAYIYASNGVDLLERRQVRAGANALLAKLEYDDKHLVKRAMDAAGNETNYEYNGRGQLTKIVDANKNTWTNQYDDKGFLTASYGPSGKKPLALYSYDDHGRISSTSDVDGHTIKFTYDNADRITQKTFEDGTSEKIGYDRLDAVSYADRAGKITKRTYDSLDRMSSIEDPLGRKSHYEWCLCGALRKLTDPAGHATEWHHDVAGRTIQKKFANGTEIKYEYEQDGYRLSSKTDALNQKTIHLYNADDTIAEIKYESAANPTSPVKYTYDPDYPVLVSATNDQGTISFEYNRVAAGPGSGQLHSISNSAIANSKIEFAYDKFGRLIKRSINGDDNTTSIKYDNLGRAVSETNLLGEFDFAYQEQGAELSASNRVTSIKYPNQTSVQFKYDGSSGEERLQSIMCSRLGQSEPLCRFDYGYDKAGQITEWKQQFGNELASQLSLHYDAAGQLTDATSQSANLNGKAKEYHFTYDPASNRIQSNDAGTIRELGYNSMNELISSATKDAGSASSEPANTSASTLEYDLNGNLIKDGTLKYSWDAENRLINIEFADGSHTSFSYDALGQRTRIVETSGNQITSAKTLLWSNGRICEERLGSTGNSKSFFNLGERNEGKNYYYHRDHLGSTRQMTDQNGTVQSRIDFSPFGEPAISSIATVLPAFRYAGYYSLSTSDLYLTPFRAYDSKLGRWLSRDPLGEFGLTRRPNWSLSSATMELSATNLYAYVGNNTLRYTDPLGLQYDGSGSNGFNTGAPTGAGQGMVQPTLGPIDMMIKGIGDAWNGLWGQQNSSANTSNPNPYNLPNGTQIQSNSGTANSQPLVQQQPQLTVDQTRPPEPNVILSIPNAGSYMGYPNILVQVDRTGQIFQVVNGTRVPLERIGCQ